MHHPTAHDRESSRVLALNAAKTNQLIFSAGPDGEAHGLLGKIVAKY
jgi:hypothetical protein